MRLGRGAAPILAFAFWNVALADEHDLAGVQASRTKRTLGHASIAGVAFVSAGSVLTTIGGAFILDGTIRLNRCTASDTCGKDDNEGLLAEGIPVAAVGAGLMSVGVPLWVIGEAHRARSVDSIGLAPMFGSGFAQLNVVCTF